MEGLSAEWVQAEVGMYWTRDRNGRRQRISTWSCGDEHGYALTENFKSVKFNSLADAVAEADRRMRAG